MVSTVESSFHASPSDTGALVSRLVTVRAAATAAGFIGWAKVTTKAWSRRMFGMLSSGGLEGPFLMRKLTMPGARVVNGEANDFWRVLPVESFSPEPTRTV